MEILENLKLKDALVKTQRPVLSFEKINAVIDGVFSEVKDDGDVALKKYTHFFDKLDIKDFQLSKVEIDSSEKEIPVELKKAILKAKKNIEVFHESQKMVSTKVETSPGVKCWQESRPIEKVGIYIPAGTAPLFSTVLMLAIPAKIAACKKIVLCTPPKANGKIDPAILYAAKITGVTEIFTVGGAQAIAAMTFGTESIPKVYKIFGPGNQYVTSAKMKAQQFGVAIDMPAGPSELLVYADESCNPAFVAADLLSQAEHGSDSQVICVSENKVVVDAIQKEVINQIKDLPRAEIAGRALENSKFVISPDISYSIDFINEYAPEHLILTVKELRSTAIKINNAGSVFLGNYTPESAGDYASGTNHTLPTSGFAKSYSGVNLATFQKQITFQEISEAGLSDLGETIELMAEAEQLQAHRDAVTIRLKTIQS